MVAGVFTARWTLPILLKGTRQVFADLAEHKHLIPIAILAGMLWAVANTLTVFCPFAMWGCDCVSLVEYEFAGRHPVGRLLFGELKGASGANVAKVLLGALAIVGAAIMLGFSTIHGGGPHAGPGSRWRARCRGREFAVGNDVRFRIARPTSAE